jgi:plasmid rolling circle replication initiator protein Rep
LKDTDYIYPEDDNLTDTVVDVLRVALKGRRLYAFGGQLKKLASQLGIEEVTEGDLVHIDDEAIRTDVAEAIEVYNWSSGYLNYFLKYQLPHPAYAPKDTRTVAATSSQPHTHSNHQD